MNHTLLIPRRDQEETAIAIVKLYAPSNFSKGEILAGIKSSVTNWLISSEKGKKIHPRVKNSFNVGDLSEHLKDTELKKELSAHVIEIISIEVLSEEYPTEWEYDTCLYENL